VENRTKGECVSMNGSFENKGECVNMTDSIKICNIRERLNNALTGDKPIPKPTETTIDALNQVWVATLQKKDNEIIRLRDRLQTQVDDNKPLREEVKRLKKIEKAALAYVAWTRQISNKTTTPLRVGDLARAVAKQ